MNTAPNVNTHAAMTRILHILTLPTLLRREQEQVLLLLLLQLLPLVLNVIFFLVTFLLVVFIRFTTATNSPAAVVVVVVVAAAFFLSFFFFFFFVSSSLLFFFSSSLLSLSYSCFRCWFSGASYVPLLLPGMLRRRVLDAWRLLVRRPHFGLRSGPEGRKSRVEKMLLNVCCSGYVQTEELLGGMVKHPLSRGVSA